MKRIMLTTALTALLSGPVLAASHSEMPFLDNETFASGDATDILASDLIGKPVYVTAQAIDANTVDVNAIEWERVGDVNDIILTSDGVQAVVLDIGGFLGMGEKQVAMDLGQLHMISGVDDGAEIYIVYTGDRAMFESAGEFDLDRIGSWAEDDETEANADGTTEVGTMATTGGSVTPAEGAMAPADGEAAEAEAETEMAQAEYPAMLTPPAPANPRENYEAVAWDQLTTEDLTGAIVYDVNDQNIGEIDRLFVSEDGKLNGAVIDVGGFLGLGEKPVLVDMNSLSIQRDQSGDLYISIDVSQEELEAQDAYEG